MEEDWKKAYQKELLKFYHRPLGAEKAPAEAFSGWSRNRTCGDEVTISLTVKNGLVEDVWQQTRGCAIATATASLLVKTIPGLEMEEACSRLQSILLMVRKGTSEGDLGDLQLLCAVHPLSSRHECVGVAVRAFEGALTASQSSNGNPDYGVR